MIAGKKVRRITGEQFVYFREIQQKLDGHTDHHGALVNHG
jgi:hypothetical protein